MSLTATIEGGKELCDWFAAVGRRAGRTEILPFLKAAFEPVVAAEKGHIKSISGALASSLSVRAGAGDKPGRVSVFSAPSATTKQVVKAWSGSSKRQHHQFAGNATTAGYKRYRVFYAPFVELGHRVVKRNKAGRLYSTGTMIPAHPFARPAMEALGQAAADEAEANVLNHLFGE